MYFTEFGSMVALKWIDLDIEYDYFCRYDSVKVYDPYCAGIYGG